MNPINILTEALDLFTDRKIVLVWVFIASNLQDTATQREVFWVHCTWTCDDQQLNNVKVSMHYTMLRFEVTDFRQQICRNVKLKNSYQRHSNMFSRSLYFQRHFVFLRCALTPNNHISIYNIPIIRFGVMLGSTLPMTEFAELVPYQYMN